MLLDLDRDTGTARVDAQGLNALLDAASGPEGTGHPDAVLALASGRLDTALSAIAGAHVEIDLVVAGHDTRLEHRAWLGHGSLALLLGVGPGVLQLMSSPPDFLTAALVRLVRLRPRRTQGRAARPFPVDRLPELVDADDERRRAALADAEAGFAWHLRVAWPDGAQESTAVDGPDGLFLADLTDATLRPFSNTEVYRILSVATPGPDLRGAAPLQR